MKNIWLFVILIFFFISCGNKPESLDWQGKIIEEDGIIVVNNPEKPLFAGKILSYEEDLTIGSPEGNDDAGFSFLIDIDVDSEGNIYALDRKEYCIKIYSPKGKFVRSFGRQGPGPKEFQQLSAMMIAPDHNIWISCGSNLPLMIFSPEGKFLRTQRFFYSGFIPFLIDDDFNLYGMGFSIIKGKSGAWEGTEQQIIKIPPPYDSTTALAHASEIGNTSYRLLHGSLYSGGGFAWGNSKEYVIHLLDSDGKEFRRITKNTPGSPPPLSNKKKPLRHFSNLIADDNGFLFVEVGEDTPLRSSLFDIYDNQSRFISTAVMPYGVRIINKNKLYAISFNEEGYQLIKRYKLDWNY